MAEKKKCRDELPEIRVRGVSPQLHDDLINISRNEGRSLSDILKPKLREVADSYPERMKQPPKDY